MNPQPFPRVESIYYEGSISTQLIHFFTVYSPHLARLTIKSADSVVEPDSFMYLHINPRNWLTRLELEMTVATKGSVFIAELQRILASSDCLEYLGNTGQWSNVVQSQIDVIRQNIENNNWDVNLQ